MRQGVYFNVRLEDTDNTIVDRLGVGSQLQGGEPQDLPVNLQGRLLGKSAEHTHEGDLVGEPQLIVAAPPQGDLGR